MQTYMYINVCICGFKVSKFIGKSAMKNLTTNSLANTATKIYVLCLYIFLY